MNKFIIATLAVLAILTLVVFMYRRRAGEAFSNPTTPENPNASCPTEAIRGPDGRIHIKPGDRTFQTLPDYVAYLSGLYANGATCIAPKVQPNRSTIDGVLGGLGNGVQSPESLNLEGTTRDVMDHSTDETTSRKDPINKLDDYEYTRVFESERGSRNSLETGTKNQLLGQRVHDWANLPFNSEERAKQEDTFIAGRMEDAYRDPKSGVFFNNVRGTTVEPPDVEASRAREQKLLAAYRPTDISKHMMDNETEAVANLVNKVYGEDPNWEPVVSKTGENQWAVTELKPKLRKEKYEEGNTQELSMLEAKGLVVPPPSIEINDRIRGDPYFDKSGVGDRDNNRLWNYKDFNKWTPGLERMFAPTMDNKAWY